MIRAGSRGGLAAVGVAAVGMALAGCGSSSSKTSAAPTTAAAPAASATTAAPGTGSGAAGGTMVTVIDTDFHQAFSTMSFQPGTYTFVTENKGKAPHALTVAGPGVNSSTSTIEPGQSVSLTVTLQAGSYDIYCPVPGHKALGMNTEITVGGGSAGGPAPTTAAPVTAPPTTAAPVTTVPGGGSVSY